MKSFIIPLFIAASVTFVAAPESFAAAKLRTAEECVPASQVATKFQGKYQRNVQTGCTAPVPVSATMSERMARPGIHFGSLSAR
jgi:hypothetical protein